MATLVVLIKAEFILKCLKFEEWIQLAQDRGQWRALVNMAMNLRVLTPWY
jgi:hypothetical protein